MAVKKKYNVVIRSEIAVLAEILESGINSGILKPISNIPLVAGNIFFGSIVMIAQIKKSDIDLKEMVDIMCDRLLNGHKK